MGQTENARDRLAAREGQSTSEDTRHEIRPREGHDGPILDSLIQQSAGECIPLTGRAPQFNEHRIEATPHGRDLVEDPLAKNAAWNMQLRSGWPGAVLPLLKECLTWNTYLPASCGPL
jgi:hypothetical protein